ncbi:MAG: DUF1330 domain-containing protein [Patescibacteria group bacterium]
MIYCTQLVYIIEGREEVFDQFEEMMIPLIEFHNGKILLRTRLNAIDVVERSLELPYEIHLTSFESDADFENYLKDKRRTDFLELKESSIKSSFIIKGHKL